MATSTSLERRVLHSWKEISSYTGRGVRTIQRYETQFGFPIHRPAGSPRSAVLAFTDEVDGWLAGSPTRSAPRSAPQLETASAMEHAARMHAVWLKAKLGCERAECLAQRLLATKELLDQLTKSLNEGRQRRAQIQAKIETTSQVVPKQSAASPA
ncbi:MAG TPA: hypothetical protein VG498_17555 [Terriglobales bacterium]|nr:hypothetical protein [Terriglobales bacterium]